MDASILRSATKIRQSVVVGTKFGPTRFVSFTGLADAGEHVALVFGAGQANVPLVRIHSECLTGDVFHSSRCDCGEQLEEAQAKMAKDGGILLYLRQEGRGIGLYNKLDAYALQDQGLDTFEANVRLSLPADGRSYLVAAQMLKALGHDRIRLLTNNPEKAAQLRRDGIEVVELVPTDVHLKKQNREYLRAKARGGHSINLSVIEQGEKE